MADYGAEEGQAVPTADGPASPPGLTKTKAPPKGAPTPPAAAVDTPARLEQLEKALLEFLTPKPNGKEHLPKVGLFVRSRNLAPVMGLKRFILSRSDVFTYIELENGTNLVQLAGHIGGVAPPAPGLPLKPSPAAKPETAAPANGRSSVKPAAISTADSDIDEAAMERLLVSHIMSRPAGAPAVNCPALGELCIRQGIPMKGRLMPFMRARPHLFHLPDDGRQQVLLVPGAAAALGLDADGSAAAQRAGSLPSLPEDLGLAEHRAASNGGAFAGPASTVQQRRALVPLEVSTKAVAAGYRQAAGDYSRQAAGDYSRWDPLTQEMFRYVRSRGGATFSDIDSHIKGHHAALIVPTGVPTQVWKAAIFLRKRGSIFNMQGPQVTVAPHAMNADAGADRYYAGNSAEVCAPNHKTLPIKSAHQPSTIQQWQASAAASPPPPPPPAASASEAFPPLPGSKAASAGLGGMDPGSLAAERRALEEIRDDIQERLTSFRALSELQRENAGLRAACVTLGRELLSVKDEFGALRRKLAVALGPAFGPPAAAATPDLAESLSSLDLGSAANGAATGGTDDAFLPRLSASPGAASGGEIVLVGGHDGVSWLDAVDAFSPATGAWRSLPAMDRPRSFSVAVSSPDAIYVAGGGNGTDWYTSAMRLDRSAAAAGGGAWQQLAPLAVARGSMAASFASGHLYVYGGGKPGEQYSVVEWYDPHADSWHRGPELTERRFALAGATLDGALYAVGGYDGAKYLSSVERLDPREGKWGAVSSMAGQRGGHACAAAGGLLYALGGYSSTAVQACEVFDPRTGGWRPIPTLLDCRAYGGAAAVDGEVFAVGGLRSDMQTHSALLERYSPGRGGVWAQVDLPANANPRRSFLASCTLE